MKRVLLVLITLFVFSFLFAGTTRMDSFEGVTILGYDGSKFSGATIDITKIVKEDKTCLELNFEYSNKTLFRTDFYNNVVYNDFMDLKFLAAKFQSSKVLLSKYIDKNGEAPEYLPKLLYNPYFGLQFYTMPVKEKNGDYSYYIAITLVQNEKFKYYFLITDQQLGIILKACDNFDKTVVGSKDNKEESDNSDQPSKGHLDY